MNRIHLSKAEVTEVEEAFVLDALRSGWIAPVGPHVDAFEAEIAQRVGVAGALALSSGTAALHLALLDAGSRGGTARPPPHSRSPLRGASMGTLFLTAYGDIIKNAHHALVVNVSTVFRNVPYLRAIEVSPFVCC